MNVKRIAAIAGGALMVGAAAAGAVSVDSNLGSFQFMSNGDPNVKVVVGSRAAASDAVAAGNIAAMLGNLAYKETPVTVLGTDSLSCGGGTDGTAACDLSNKKVTLTVTTPGVNPASAYSMSTLVEDNLDYNPDTTRSISTTFGSGTTSFVASTGPKVITKEMTPVLNPHKDLASDGKIVYSRGSGTLTKEEQKVYVFSYVTYDATTKVLTARDSKTGYEMLFADPIPVCLDTSKTSAACAEADKVHKNNVRITFLGDKWTIMDYTVSPAASATVSQVILGKEIAHKDIMRVNDAATTPDGFTIKLVDLSGFGYGASGLPRVSFQVLDKDNNVVKQLTVDESTASTTISEANNLVIKVNSVFPGAFAKEAYADVALYSNRLDLTSGQTVSSGASHGKWYTTITSSNVSSSQGISKIQLYNDIDQVKQSPPSSTLNPGESVDVIRGLAGFKLNYLGLQTVDADSLTFAVERNRNYTILLNASVNGVAGDFIRITSGRSNAFQLTKNVDTVYVMVNTANSVIANNGEVWYVDSTSGYYINNATGSTVQYVNGTGLPYHYSSTEQANIVGNMSVNSSAWINSSSSAGAVIMIPEITEDANGTTASVSTGGSGNYHWTLLYDTTLEQFVNAIGATTIDKIGYGAGMLANNNNTAPATKENGYVSYRGSTFGGVSSLSASFTYPISIAHAKFTLTTAGTSAAANEADYTLAEGDSQDIGSGYAIKVKEIMADTSVSGGGSTGGSVDTSGLRPSVENAAVVTELSPSAPLVVFDSEASDTESLIVVGGPVVNTFAQKAGVSIAAGSEPMIKVSGSKVIVAGYTAADTQAAARELVSWLSDNRDTVRG